MEPSACPYTSSPHTNCPDLSYPFLDPYKCGCECLVTADDCTEDAEFYPDECRCKAKTTSVGDKNYDRWSYALYKNTASNDFTPMLKGVKYYATWGL